MTTTPEQIDTAKVLNVGATLMLATIEENLSRVGQDFERQYQDIPEGHAQKQQADGFVRGYLAAFNDFQKCAMRLLDGLEATIQDEEAKVSASAPAPNTGMYL